MKSAIADSFSDIIIKQAREYASDRIRSEITQISETLIKELTLKFLNSIQIVTKIDGLDNRVILQLSVPNSFGKDRV